MPKDKICDISADELQRRIDEYFSALSVDPGLRGGPSDFLRAVGMDMATARAVTTATGDAYKKHARLLRDAAVRLRAHLETSPAWAGSNQSKAIFLAKQELWDGLAYADKAERRVETDSTVRVIFGGKTGKNDAFD